MKTGSNYTVSLAKIFGFGLAIPCLGSILVNQFASELYYQDLILFVILNSISSFVALTVVIYMTFIKDGGITKSPANCVIVSSLFAMTIINLFCINCHNDTYLMLQNALAMSLGGLLFSFIWYTKNNTMLHALKFLPYIAGAGVISFMALKFAKPEFLISTLEILQNISNPKEMYMLGGLGFLIASAFFMHDYKESNDIHSFLIAIFCLTYSSSGFLFEINEPWSAPWWFWHAIKTHAYAFLTFCFFRRNYEYFKDLKTRTEQLQHSILEQEEITKIIKQRDKELAIKAKELERSNKELENFAYIASHDMREPLRKVIAFGDLLQRKCSAELSDKGRDYVERMTSATYRMQKLLDDLLKYSRVSSGSGDFHTVSLSALMEEIISDLEEKIKETHSVILVTSELPEIEADETQIRQLFQNLISNSIKFTANDTHPLIKIKAEKQNYDGKDFVEITLKDNGIGFDEKFKHKIFEQFQRLHGKNEYEGTGMGLAICKKISERHDGSIDVHSKEGEGSTFYIKLPVKHIDSSFNIDISDTKLEQILQNLDSSFDLNEEVSKNLN